MLDHVIDHRLEAIVAGLAPELIGERHMLQSAGRIEALEQWPHETRGPRRPRSRWSSEWTNVCAIASAFGGSVGRGIFGSGIFRALHLGVRRRLPARGPAGSLRSLSWGKRRREKRLSGEWCSERERESEGKPEDRAVRG